jgi:cyclin K
MSCWYFDKSELRNTPSLRDGIDGEKEARYRREGARFIMDIGNQMGLRYDTMATGVVFFHRFYMFHSFNAFPRYVSANLNKKMLLFFSFLFFLCWID